MGEKKLIDYRIFDPSRPSLFKTKANERAELRLLFCSGHERCSLYERGMCAMWRYFGGECPYGNISTSIGPTRRAAKFREWVRVARERVSSVVSQLSQAPDKMAQVGDYVFFPYPFWSLDKRMPLNPGEFGTLFSSGIEFIPSGRFDSAFIQAVIGSRPMSMMGGEITQYQKETVPVIVLHLEEVFPELYREWSLSYPETASRFETKNHVGRKALVSSLDVGTIIPHKDGQMEWTGDEIIVKNYASPFLPMKTSGAQLRFVPAEDATIKITSNDQVGTGTKFVD